MRASKMSYEVFEFRQFLAHLGRKPVVPEGWSWARQSCRNRRRRCWDDAAGAADHRLRAGRDADRHYDGEGRRVKRALGAQTTVYVYNAMGELAEEAGGDARD
jgi:hypothetical protein